MTDLFIQFLDFLWESFANVAAVLVGCMITTKYIPQKRHHRFRVILSFVLITAWMFIGRNYLAPDEPDGSIPGPFVPIMVFSGLFLFSGLSVLFWCHSTWHQALFAVTVSYALQNICERIIEMLMWLIPGLPRQWIIPLLIATLWWYNRFCGQYKQRQTMFDFSNINNRFLLFVASGVMIGCVVIDLLLKVELGNSSPELNVMICVMMIMFSAMSVIVSMSHLRETDSKMRAEEAANLLRIEQSRYEQDRQIHEAISLKCHDIKHRIAAMRSSSSDDEYRTELKKIGKLVDIFDTTPHSQNAALDVVLANKMLTCNSLNITITCMADGRRMGFMADGDIYALFGNILDNAIEAAQQVQDPEQRMITLNVETQGDFLAISCENFFTGTLTFEDGLPMTTKADQANHGYGTHSIRILTEKYDGLLKVSSQDDIFTLSIILPIPRSYN